MIDSFNEQEKARRDAIIDAIPDEGALVYTAPLSGRSFAFTQDDADKIVDQFFEGKTPLPKGQKKAKILLGAPGAGKSYNAKNAYDALSDKEKRGTIYVSYDEDGAIFAVPEYLEELRQHVPDYVDEHLPVRDTTLDVRTKLWDDYRPFSQYIRSQILKRALREGYSIVVDTTSSSMGTKHLIKALRELNYNRVSGTGTYAPFAKSLERLHGRVRPASNEEAVTKRVGDVQAHNGAMNMIAPLIELLDEFDYEYNPSDDVPPALAFSYRHGALAHQNPGVIKHMIEETGGDVEAITSFIAQHDLNRDYVHHAEETYALFTEQLTNIAATAKPEKGFEIR